MSAEQSTTTELEGSPRLFPALGRLNDWPWWLLLSILFALLIALQIVSNDTWSNSFRFVTAGVRTTITLAIIGYAIALVVGLVIGLGRVANTDTFFGVFYYNFATFYVEIVRGIPMLVIIMYVSFVGVPMIVDGVNALGEWLSSLGVTGIGTSLAELTSRNFSNAARVAFALGIAYGAFEAEVFRAGIESIEKGQMEAARSLGMTYVQSMRHIILPQAIRSVMPALGNDFVAMVKDSSLASVLGVQDLTQLTKLYASSTFIFFETWSITAFIYLIVTISLTRLVRWLERRLRRGRR